MLQLQVGTLWAHYHTQAPVCVQCICCAESWAHLGPEAALCIHLGPEDVGSASTSVAEFLPSPNQEKQCSVCHQSIFSLVPESQSQHLSQSEGKVPK